MPGPLPADDEKTPYTFAQWVTRYYQSLGGTPPAKRDSTPRWHGHALVESPDEATEREP